MVNFFYETNTSKRFHMEGGGGSWMESSRRESKKDTGKYVCCVGSAVSVFLLDPHISMQNFEVGEMYILSVGRQHFFPYELSNA